MPKIQFSRDRYHITIPREYVKLLAWKKGQEIAIIPGRDERTLVLKEMPNNLDTNH